MLNQKSLEDLYRHMEWADAAVWFAVLSHANGSADERLRQSLYHLHMVQWAFLRIWRGEPRETPYPTFDEAWAMMFWARSYYGEAAACLQGMDGNALSEPLHVPWAALVEQRLGRAPEATTLGETALQVVLHSTYHRGQVNARLRELGGEPPLVDYIAWVWLGRPTASWPDAAAHILSRG